MVEVGTFGRGCAGQFPIRPLGLAVNANDNGRQLEGQIESTEIAPLCACEVPFFEGRAL
jgi:hypothetical protein